jgi:hypothetical protein
MGVYIGNHSQIINCVGLNDNSARLPSEVWGGGGGLRKGGWGTCLSSLSIPYQCTLSGQSKGD